MQDYSGAPNPVECLADEFVRRTRQGEHPSLTEYCERFPQYADEIRRLFPTAIVLERLKPSADELQAAKLRQTMVPSSMPRQLGDYLILREIGRGGMGVVYEAEQQSLGRRVALKILSGVSSQDPKHLARFDREARSAARLHHTNIVPVFGVGEYAGMHYLVMQLITGKGLDQVLLELRRVRKAPAAAEVRTGAAVVTNGTPRDQDPLAVSIAQALQEGGFQVLPGPLSGPLPAPLDTGTAVPPSVAHEPPALQPARPTAAAAALSHSRTADSTVVVAPLRSQSRKHSARSHVDATYWRSVCRIGIEVARALEYAHAQGILHRDIKPSNLLLDVHGVVWVADFGLAKSDDSGNLTQSGEFVGTLRYMAPEQFHGKSDQCSDVYSLGLTLYELLTLEPAFAATDRGELISQVMHAKPRPLRQIDPAIPADLETIVGKAMSRESDQRYRSSAEMADDLARFLEDLPIAARPASPPERLWRWCRRNPYVAVPVILSAVLLVAWGATSSWLAYRLEGARQEADFAGKVSERRRIEAESNRREAQAGAEESRSHLVRLNVAHGTKLLEEGDPLGSLTYFAEALRLDRGNPDREAAHRLRVTMAARYAPRLVAAGQAAAGSESDQISPDGKLFASGPAIRFLHGKSHQIVPLQIYRDNSGHLLRPVLGTLDRPDDRNSDGLKTVQIHTLPACDVVCRLEHDETVVDFAFSPDSRSVATACRDGSIRIWDAHTAELKTAVHDRHPDQRAVTWLADGKSLVSMGLDATVRIWDPLTGVLRSSIGLSSARYATLIHPQGYLAVVDGDYSVQVFDLVTGTPKGKPIDSGPFQVIDFIRDGREILLAGGQPFVRRYETDTGKLIARVTSHSGEAQWLQASGQDGRLLIESTGRTLRVWNGDSGTVVNSRLGWPRTPLSIAFNSPGDRLGLIATDGTFTVWNPQSGQMLFPPLRHLANVTAAQMTGDKRYVLTRGRDRSLRLWDLSSAQVSATAMPATTISSRLKTHNPDGRHALGFGPGGFGPGAHTILDTSTRNVVATLETPAKSTPCEFSGDGRFVLTRSPDGSVRIWDATTGKPASEIMKYPAAVQSARINHDGSRVLTLASDGIVRTWNPAVPGHPLSEFFVGGARFELYIAPDGNHAVTCQQSGYAGSEKIDSLWDLRDGSLVGEFPRPNRSQAVAPVVFSPDGKLWLNAASGELIVRETQTGKVFANCGPQPDVVFAASFSGSARVVTGSMNGVLRIWDLGTSRLKVEFPGHYGRVLAVNASSNGRYLFSAGDDQTARIWDAATGEFIALLKHSEPVSLAWFSPDTSTLITVERRGAVRRWNLEVNDRPVDDWVAIAGILAGKASGVGGEQARENRYDTSADWERLRAKYPDELATSALAEENWSRQSAEAPVNGEPVSEQP